MKRKRNTSEVQEELELNWYHHFCILSSHERLNGEHMKIKLYFEVFIYSMIFDFFISLRTNFCR